MRFEVLMAVNVKMAVLRNVGYTESHPGEQQTFRSDNVLEHGFEENIITKEEGGDMTLKKAG
jgi:hypothetical protein